MASAARWRSCATAPPDSDLAGRARPARITHDSAAAGSDAGGSGGQGGFGGVLGHETALGVGDGQLELGGTLRKEGALRSEVFQLHPLALETAAGVLDEAARGEQVELGEDLEAVADSEEVTSVVAEVLQGFADLLFGDEARDAAGHDVVAVAEAA